MAIESDEPMMLPPAPPPRPAAKRAAIDAALQRFDAAGMAPAASTRRGAPQPVRWASINRRPAGALAAAAIIAIVGIPAIQVALRDAPSPAVTETPSPATVSPRPEITKAPGRDLAGQAEVQDEKAIPVDETAETSVSQGLAAPAEDRLGFAAEPGSRQEAVHNARAASTAAPPASVSAPPAAPSPPPPPPPPPAEAQAQAPSSAMSDSNIVVTGTRVGRSEKPSAAPLQRIDPYADFLARLRAAVAAGDRSVIIAQVGFPLKVSSESGIRTYHSADALERDFDQVFTPAVRRAALSLQPGSLKRRNGGRLRGDGRLWFGCGVKSCSPGSAVQIREIVP